MKRTPAEVGDGRDARPRKQVGPAPVVIGGTSGACALGDEKPPAM